MKRIDQLIEQRDDALDALRQMQRTLSLMDLNPDTRSNLVGMVMQVETTLFDACSRARRYEK
jgi:hypothetical protein